jgi:hypothetical protein
LCDGGRQEAVGNASLSSQAIVVGEGVLGGSACVGMP